MWRATMHWFPKNTAETCVREHGCVHFKALVQILSATACEKKIFSSFNGVTNSFFVSEDGFALTPLCLCAQSQTGCRPPRWFLLTAAPCVSSGCPPCDPTGPSPATKSTWTATSGAARTTAPAPSCSGTCCLWPSTMCRSAHTHAHRKTCRWLFSFLQMRRCLFVVVCQVEVCTVYACVRSNVTQTTTVEDLPADIAAPLAKVLSSR